MKAEPPSAHRFFFEERLSGTRVSAIPFGECLSGTRYSSIPFGECLAETRVSSILFGERLSGTRYSPIPFGERLAGTRYSFIPFGERLAGIRHSSILFRERLSEPPDSHCHISMIPHQHHSSFNCRLPGGRRTQTTGRRSTADPQTPGRSTGSNRGRCARRPTAGRPTSSSRRPR